VAVFGLGPIGDMSSRIALHRGHRVIAVDLAKRIDRARRHGIEVIDLRDYDNSEDVVAEAIREMTDGRGPDSVIDAVGMEAHGSVSKKMMNEAGVDRLSAFYAAIRTVRRGGTISLIGVYGGQADPLPMLTLFDKQIQLRMGQANVKRWVDDIMPLLMDGDPLGAEFTRDAPLGERVQRKRNPRQGPGTAAMRSRTTL